MKEAISRESFSLNLRRATDAAKAETLKNCTNELPSGTAFLVRLNCSYDRNSLAPGEYFFDDHNSAQTDLAKARTHDEVVQFLWREGKAPEWINITPFDVDSQFTFYELSCCGRFTDDPKFLYHQGEGYPPFHLFGPILPKGDFDFERDGKFDLRCYKLSKK